MRPLDHETATFLRAILRCEEESTSPIAELAAKISHWEDVVEGARQHGVLPVLYSAIATMKTVVPAHALELAKREFERNAFHCISNAAELIEVLGVFEAVGIAAVPFKGVVLGASAYGEMTTRTAGDIDMLIHYDDLMRAAALLNARGYELTSKILEDGSPAVEDDFEFHFERASDGMVLELRWKLELTKPRFRRDLGLDWVWPHRRKIIIAGAEVPSLDPVSSLLVLCMHGSKHIWSRLVWIHDVAKLLKSEPALDWDLAQREARRVGLWRSLALGILLARRFTGCDVPTRVLRRFESKSAIRELAHFLDENLLEHPGKMPPGRIPYSIKILGVRDRLAAVLSHRFLRPNARDRAVVRLPRALEPLYYVIRPFRVLLDRSGR